MGTILRHSHREVVSKQYTSNNRTGYRRHEWKATSFHSTTKIKLYNILVVVVDSDSRNEDRKRKLQAFEMKYIRCKSNISHREHKREVAVEYEMCSMI